MAVIRRGSRVITIPARISNINSFKTMLISFFLTEIHFTMPEIQRAPSGFYRGYADPAWGSGLLLHSGQQAVTMPGL